MNLISLYEYVRCGLWASSGPFPLSAHYGLYKRGRDPPPPPPPQTLAVIWRKKRVISLSSGCSRKAGEGRIGEVPQVNPSLSTPELNFHRFRPRRNSLSPPPPPPPPHGPLPFRAFARDHVVPCSRQPPYRTGVALRVSPTTLAYKRSLLPLAPATSPTRSPSYRPPVQAARERSLSSRPTGLAPRRLTSTPHFKVNYFSKCFLYSSPLPSDNVDRVVRV